MKYLRKVQRADTQKYFIRGYKVLKLSQTSGQKNFKVKKIVNFNVKVYKSYYKLVNLKCK